MHEGKESQLVVRKSYYKLIGLPYNKLTYKSRCTNLKMLNKFLTVVKLGNKN